MKKPDSVRKALMEVVPSLRGQPDQLLVYIDEGHIAATNASSLSFEYRYTLSIVLTDYAGSVDPLIVTLLAWIKRNQPDILAHSQPGVRFEADHLNHTTCDVLFTLPLTESVVVTRQSDGTDHIAHVDESVPTWENL